MEDNDNSNSRKQSNDDGDQNRIVQQLLRTNISSKRKQLFRYDIRNFPDWLLIEILVRLPMKSIFMLKTVCKHWRTLISHPSFCRFYYSTLNSNAALSSRPFRILNSFAYVPTFKEFLNRLRSRSHISSEFSVVFLSNREERERHIYDQFRVLDTSNGLLLCCSWNSTPCVYYICDPLTGQWISLPRTQQRFQDHVVHGLITRVSENHTLTGYTVVTVDFRKSRSNYLYLEMFSSEAGKWIHHQVPCVIPTGIGTGLGVHGGCPIHCYGALHWRVIYAMIAFDPCKDPKSARLIPFPNDRDLKSELDNIGMFQLCGECQGTLRYFEVAEDPTEFYLFTMWAMKDYEKGEWCCEFKVRRSEVHSSDLELSKWLLEDGWFFPLSFHPLNPNVVYLTCMEEPERFVSYDVLNRRLDVAYKPIDVVDEVDLSSVVRFMSPRWPLLLSVASQLPI